MSGQVEDDDELDDADEGDDDECHHGIPFSEDCDDCEDEIDDALEEDLSGERRDALESARLSRPRAREVVSGARGA